MPAPATTKTCSAAPDLSPNLILGTLQLLFWLFIRPSAWSETVARIDPTLHPAFCLGDLNREQWRNPALRRLLLMGLVVCPLLVGSLVGLILWTRGEPGKIAAYGAAAGVSAGVGGLGLATVVSLAGGVAFDLAVGMTSLVSVHVGGAGASAQDYAWLGLALGAVGSVVGTIASQKSAYSLTRQMGGVGAGMIVGFGAFGVAWAAASAVARLVLLGVTLGVAGGAALGLAGGAALGLAGRAAGGGQRARVGVAVGAVCGLAGGAALGIALGVAGGAGGDLGGLTGGIGAGIVGGLVYSALFALPYALAERIAGPWAGAMVGALGSWGAGVVLAELIARLGAPQSRAPFGLVLLLGLAGCCVGLSQGYWRPTLTYPLLVVWNTVLYRADERRSDRQCSLLAWHSAFWDEHQRLRLYGLEDHLVLAAERNPAQGQAAMEHLANGRQRWAAQAAQIELDARRLERSADVETIAGIHHSLAAGELEGPASALLRSFSRISQDVSAALGQESAYNQRLALSALEDRLDGLLRELTRSSEPYAARFRPIATQWRQLVEEHARDLAEAAEMRQEIDNPYVIGVPLTEQQEIFVGRTDLSSRIEQLLLDRRRPPLLLYGQRRMGKTSLLNNLGRLLPSTIVPFFVDLQGPASQARDHASLLYNMARGMAQSARRQRGLVLPPLSREELSADPFTGFDEWLDQVEQSLGSSTALLTLDEFECLDGALMEGRLSETAVLGMLRHLIQHRPRFKVLLAGSHTLDELQRWSSYLINVQVVHLDYLKEAEVRQLVERPAAGFALRYAPEASQQVVELTRGHPYLVQLLCSEIVALKNEQEPAFRRLARLADVEAAVPEALSHGSLFFGDIQRNQVDVAGLAVLRSLAAQGQGAILDRDALARSVESPTEIDQTLAMLQRRELIEPVGPGYRFQVELIRRWFAPREKAAGLEGNAESRS